MSDEIVKRLVMLREWQYDYITVQLDYTNRTEGNMYSLGRNDLTRTYKRTAGNSWEEVK